MKTDEAVALIEAAVGDRAGVWADLGAGEGTFTRALVELLGPTSRVYAVDQDASAVAAIARWSKGSANVVPVEADFSRPLELWCSRVAWPLRFEEVEDALRILLLF